MGFLNTDSMPRLVEKLADGDNIKITGNSKGSKVGTVVKKIVEKADEITKAIEQEVVNESYSFKVGAGNVDVSSDVEDGFGEVGIKGVTYQNLVNGSTLDNPHSTLIKPNTTYTIMAKKISGESQFNVVCDDSSHSLFIPSNAEANKIYIVKRDTYSNDTKMYFMNVTSEVAPTVIEDLIILEGDHTNNPNLPSYFEGIVGVGDKSKNLLNPKEAILGYVSSTGEFVDGSVAGNNVRTNYLLIKPNTPYIGMSQGASKLNNYSWFDENKTFIKRDSASGYAISPNNAMYIIIIS